MQTIAAAARAGPARPRVAAGLWGGAALSLALCLPPPPAAAQAEPAAGDERAVGAAADASPSASHKIPPRVELGRLLRLPDSYRRPAESRRGMGQSEWESRFELLRLDLQTSQMALEKAQTELAQVAGGSGQWSVAAPGTSPNPENTPLSYKLRQEIRRQRESIERAERKLRSLEIEADLAEVPEQWRATGVGRPPPE